VSVPPLPFRKDISRSLTDHHIRLAVDDRTVRGLVLNISGGSETYEEEIRRVPGNRMFVTDWLSSQTSNRVDVFCDAHILPFGNDAADSILLTEVLEHLADPRRALREAFRVLKNGGALLVTTPFLYQAHQRPFDFFRFTYDGLILIATEAGFRDVSVTRRGESFAVGLNALKSFHQQLQLRGIRLPGVLQLLHFVERAYVRRFAHRSLTVPLSRDPMALGYTVVARKPV
jgi:SAM-dependent methyltransferase